MSEDSPVSEPVFGGADHGTSLHPPWRDALHPKINEGGHTISGTLEVNNVCSRLFVLSEIPPYCPAP